MKTLHIIALSILVYKNIYLHLWFHQGKDKIVMLLEKNKDSLQDVWEREKLSHRLLLDIEQGSDLFSLKELNIELLNTVLEPSSLCILLEKIIALKYFLKLHFFKFHSLD